MDTTTTPARGQLLEVTAPGGHLWTCGTCPGTAWTREQPDEGYRCVYLHPAAEPCGAEGSWRELPAVTYRATVTRLATAVTDVPLVYLMREGYAAPAWATPWRPEHVTGWRVL